MARKPSETEALRAELGELIERRTGPSSAADFSRYHDDPVGFAVDVLRVSTLWDAQREHLRAVARARRVAAYGANACSKTFDDAIIAHWWIWCRGGLVIATSATERQLKDQFMRDFGRLFHQAPGLNGDLYSLALKRPAAPRSGLLCMAASAPDAFRSFHAPLLMVQLHEAQGLPDFAFASAEMMAVGEHDRVTVTGNPTQPAGEFFKRCKGSHMWTGVRFDATQHPNVLEGRVVIPGGPTRESLAQRAADYGVDSGFYVASVLGEFPVDALEGLVKPAWVLRAFELFESGALLGRATRGRLVLGVDLARFGQDRSVICVLQDPVVREFEAWQGCDLVTTTARITATAMRYGIAPAIQRDWTAEARLGNTAVGRALLERRLGDPLTWEQGPRGGLLRVDGAGLGGGVIDALKNPDAGGSVWPVEDYVGASKPVGSDAAVAKFANRRAQSCFELRRRLEAEDLALPRSDAVMRELLATSWTVNGQGRVLIESKADIRGKLSGASPDFVDALAMAVSPEIGFDPPESLCSRAGEIVI